MLAKPVGAGDCAIVQQPVRNSSCKMTLQVASLFMGLAGLWQGLERRAKLDYKVSQNIPVASNTEAWGGALGLTPLRVKGRAEPVSADTRC